MSLLEEEIFKEKAGSSFIQKKISFVLERSPEIYKSFFSTLPKRKFENSSFLALASSF